MKRLTYSVLLVLMLIATSCTAPVPDNGTPQTNGDTVSSTEEEKPVKIGIITCGEDELQKADHLKAKYGEKIENAVYTAGQGEEALISLASEFVENGCGAVVICDADEGTTAAVGKLRETYPELLLVMAHSDAEPRLLSENADIVLNSYDSGLDTAIVESAAKMGAKTFIHYTFMRHMSDQVMSERRDSLNEACSNLGITFVDSTIPDPESPSGILGTEQFISDDIKRKVEDYGAETAFFSTDDSTQATLIAAVLDNGALYPPQSLSRTYGSCIEGFNVSVPDDKKGDQAYIIGELKKAVSDLGGTGRFATQLMPMNALLVEAGTEYALKYLGGETTGKNDADALSKILSEISGGGMTKVVQGNADGEFENCYYITPVIVEL